MDSSSYLKLYMYLYYVCICICVISIYNIYIYICTSSKFGQRPGYPVVGEIGDNATKCF